MAPSSNITLDSLIALYDSLPKMLPLPEAIIIPQRMFDKHVFGLQFRFNNLLNMQSELFGMKVYIDPFPRRYLGRLVLRSQYKTRSGFKQARLYWRSKVKMAQRAEEDVAYLLHEAAYNTDSRFVSWLMR